MKRIFAVGAVIVASVVTGGLVLGWLLWTPLSIAEITHAVERDTGRSLIVSGRARLSLWPELAIELTGVELSNPAGMYEGRFANAEAVRLKLAAASLWRGNVEISEIVAVRPRINLVVDSAGRSNFTFARDGDQQPESTTPLPPIVIADGVVSYLNERSGAAFTATDVDAAVSQASLDAPLEVTGAFNWNDRRSTVALYAKSPARLTTEGSPTDFTISTPHLSAAFSGRAVLKDAVELAGTVDFDAGSLADLLIWAGLAASPPAGLPALSARGALDLSGEEIRLTGAQLVLGAANARGDLAVNLSGPRAHVTARLGVDRLDLGVFTGNLEGDEGSTPVSGWSDAALDLEILSILEAELSMNATEIAYGEVLVGPSRLDVRLHAGALEVKVLETELYGGSASGRLMLDGSGDAAAIAVALKGEGIDGGRLVSGLLGHDHVAGTADLELDVSAKGASQAELVARLKGRAEMRLSGGSLVEIDIPALVDHVTGEVARGWTAAPAGETPFARLAASFVVEDGIAETEDLSLVGPVAEVAGTGSIDVLRRRVDLKLQPRVLVPPQGSPAKETAIALPVPVVIEGSWSAPLIYPDVEGILKDPEEAYETLRRLIKAKAGELDFMPENLENDASEAAATR